MAATITSQARAASGSDDPSRAILCDEEIYRIRDRKDMRRAIYL
jgi:hypothetical protein